MPIAQAKGTTTNCEFILEQKQSAQVKELVSEDAFAQWLKWEQTENVIQFRRSTEPIKLLALKVPLNKAVVKTSLGLKPDIVNFFAHAAEATAFIHPFNKSDTAAWFGRTPSLHISTLPTASRSLVFTGGLKGFSIKTATDHPHGLDKISEIEKANTSDDLDSALLYTEHFASQDQLIGKDEKLILLPDVLTVSAADNPNGYVVRDIRQLDDGHYYLPAFSIPFVGLKIARLHKSDPFDFWEKHYAQALGEAKARLLLRYGLQMETPNPQNILIQLDRNLLPTGRIVLRDLGDSFFVESFVDKLGFQAQAKKASLAGYEPVKILQPFAINSLWRFHQGGENGFSEWEVKLLVESHNKAFASYILKELKSSRQYLAERDLSREALESLDKYLKSREGQRLIEQYRLRLL